MESTPSGYYYVGGYNMEYIENELVELKSTLSEETKNEIIAFLNTSGGTIYIGLNNDGSTFKPFKEINKDYVDLKISNWMNDVF
jgi:ATP-dependent DNA helicase RecG